MASPKSNVIRVNTKEKVCNDGVVTPKKGDCRGSPSILVRYLLNAAVFIHTLATTLGVI